MVQHLFFLNIFVCSGLIVRLYEFSFLNVFYPYLYVLTYSVMIGNKPFTPMFMKCIFDRRPCITHSVVAYMTGQSSLI